MRPRPRRHLPGWMVLLCALAALLWSGFLGRAHLAGERSALDRAEAELADWRLLVAGRRTPPGEIVIVAIDDETVAREKGYPLARSTLARLVEAIGAARPRALAVDLLLIDAGAAEADRVLAAALARFPSVLAAAGRFAAGSAGDSQAPEARELLWPAPPFDRLSHIGLVNVATDPSSAPRHLPLLFQSARGPVPSFALLAAARYAGQDPVLGTEGVRLAGRFTKLDLGQHLPLRFYGPRGTFETLSAGAMLAGEVPMARLEDRLVVLGVTATAVGDTFGTAFDPVTPGVEVLATGMAQLLGGAGLVRDRAIRFIDVALTIALGIGAVLAILWLPLGIGIGLVGLGLGGWLLATVTLFAEGYWFSAALPLAAALPAVALATLLRQSWDRRRGRDAARAAAALRSFQAPLLAERIARDPDFLREPVLQTAAILFIDLAGFTGLSEQAGPQRTREFLKAFHTLVENEVTAHGGLVMAFMGDGAMIVFGVPEPRSDDAGRAFDAAWALIGDTQRWIGAKGGEDAEHGLRIGAHFGPVIVSRLGHEAHQHITASGDSVNVASRLMEVAKAHGATLAVSSAFLDAIGATARDHGAPDALREVAIRGRSQPVSVAFWTVPAASVT